MLSASALPRKLKSEEIATEFPGIGYLVTSRREYVYTSSGLLDKVYRYTKKSDSDESDLDFVSIHKYVNNRLERIQRINAQNQEIGSISFTYDQSERISKIEEVSYGQLTKAVITYNDALSQTKIDYVFNNGNTMSYSIKYKDQNIIEDVAKGNTTETGKYVFDSKINPFYLLGVQDIFLSNTSKNNMIGQDKDYGGNIPTVEAYQFDYRYDESGYPELLIKGYRGFTTKKHIGREITEYMYY